MVTQTFEAIYDGKVLRPKRKLEIKPNTAVMVTVKSVKARRIPKKSFLDVIEKLNVEAPPDWSENIEEYLQAEKRAHER
jgi:predicted DNA-binding antitoxin AbrB/MazE fold protein